MGCSYRGYPSYIITQKLRILKNKLRCTFGRSNLQRSLEYAQAALLEVEDQMHTWPDIHDLATQQQCLFAQLLSLKKDLENSLRQKAKLQWLKLGDDNTSFFHQSIKHWNRSNRINVLVEDGMDIVYPKQIQRKFFDFYSGLFGTALNNGASVDISVINHGPILSRQQGQLLDLTFTPEEIKMAM